MLKRVALISIAWFVGCDQSIVPRNDSPIPIDLGCPAPPDMAAPPAKCAAAKGLNGDNLICVDFGGLAALTDQKLTGWDFTTNCGGNFWEISAGKLQLKNFSTFMSNCGFLMPALSAADYQKYSGFTLSVIHRVDVSEIVNQRAQIMLGSDDQSNRLLDWMTGKQPRKQWIQIVSKADLPLAAMGNFQPLFKLSAGNTAGGGFTGWQIESIAINGIP